MKLHRLTLVNFRGVKHREIAFPDSGVVVVHGANEIGKTSMIEALDMLLETKDRSKNKDVLAVRPADADVGSEVTAEISTGPYRFIYHKRFHKRPETLLTVSEPRREQLTGDDAHERVRGILDETVDTALWKAQRVLQAGSTAAVDLSGCDALSRALDAAAGDAAASGTESLLLDRIEAEYLRYFTPSGRREAGDWAAANSALANAEAEVQRCAALVADVDERVRRHDELAGQLAELTAQQREVSARRVRAQQAAEAVAELTKTLREAELGAEAAKIKSAASSSAQDERQRLRADLDTRMAAVAAAEAEMGPAVAAEETARLTAESAAAAADAAAGALADADRRVALARKMVEQLETRSQAEQLAARLTKIDTNRGDHHRIGEELAAITFTEDELRRIEEAAAAVDLAQATLAAISATVEFTAAADIELTSAGKQMALLAGDSWSTTVTVPTEVEVAGVLTARITPGATALDAQAGHAAARQRLSDLLTAAGVAGVAAARGIDQRRREMIGSRDRLDAALAALCGDDDVERLRTRLAELRAAQPAEAPDITGEAARNELDAAETAHRQAAADCEARRAEETAAREERNAKSTRTTVLRASLSSLRAELEAVVARLADRRGVIADGALAAEAEANRQAADAAAGEVARLSAQLAQLVPDAVAAELDEASEAAEFARAERDRVAGELRDVRVELELIGSEGRQSQLDAAQADRERAAAAHARTGRRARGAQLLRTVMYRHRDDARSRYVAPFRAEIERLGRPVFGESFQIDIDTDLCITTRTLGGRTVRYEALSGGAKEQLGILTRLAGAALVGAADTVPVIIDDALGFTDPQRLLTMAAAFETVGGAGQVIVLTCTAERFAGIQGAHRIELQG